MMMMNVMVSDHNKKSERNLEKNSSMYWITSSYTDVALWCYKWRKAPWISKDYLDILGAEMQNGILIAKMQAGPSKISTKFAFL